MPRWKYFSKYSSKCEITCNHHHKLNIVKANLKYHITPLLFVLKGFFNLNSTCFIPWENKDDIITKNMLFMPLKLWLTWLNYLSKMIQRDNFCPFCNPSKVNMSNMMKLTSFFNQHLHMAYVVFIWNMCIQYNNSYKSFQMQCGSYFG